MGRPTGRLIHSVYLEQTIFQSAEPVGSDFPFKKRLEKLREQTVRGTKERNSWKSVSFGTWTVGKEANLWYIINNYPKSYIEICRNTIKEV